MKTSEPRNRKFAINSCWILFTSKTRRCCCFRRKLSSRVRYFLKCLLENLILPPDFRSPRFRSNGGEKSEGIYRIRRLGTALMNRSALMDFNSGEQSFHGRRRCRSTRMLWQLWVFRGGHPGAARASTTCIGKKGGRGRDTRGACRRVRTAALTRVTCTRRTRVCTQLRECEKERERSSASLARVSLAGFALR